MERAYKNLLSPIRFGNVVLKNRTAYPNASPHFFQGPESFPAEGYLTFVSGLAKNGCALVTVAEWDNYGAQRQGPADADFTHMQAFDLKDPSTHNYFSQLADEVHFYGSKLILSAKIEFPEGYSLQGGMSFGPGVPPSETKHLPKEMIPACIDEFVEKIRMYKNFGYDGVSFRADMFLCRSKTERSDEYGGSIENRGRYLVELCRRVKKVLGRDFITEATIAGEQPNGYNGELPLGYTAEETVRFAKTAQGAIDILQLREKNVCQAHPIGFNFSKGQHDVLKVSEAIKKAGINIITAPNGGFQDPEELEGYIAQGKCDMFYMARAFICDSEYGKKLYAGAGSDITPCLWCNKCHGTILKNPDPWLSFCSVNPIIGIEHKLHRMLPDSAACAKKVAVIGGGPTGLRAAIYAAQQGHRVTLFEKSGVLGGQLIHGDYFSFKWPVGEFKSWLIRTVEKLGVDIKLNTAPTPPEIEKAGYDAVIAATGATANIPGSIKGISNPDGSLKPEYMTCIDTFGNHDKLGKNVIIVGGSETGMETAMYLAENGHDVTVLTRQDELAHDASRLHYITMSWIKPVNPDGTGRHAAAWEKYDNLRGIVGATTTEISGGTVKYRDSEGEHELNADSVVICGGMNPCLDEAMSFADSAPRFTAIGDCNGGGNLQRCMRAALSVRTILDV